MRENVPVHVWISERLWLGLGLGLDRLQEGTLASEVLDVWRRGEGPHSRMRDLTMDQAKRRLKSYEKKAAGASRAGR